MIHLPSDIKSRPLKESVFRRECSYLLLWAQREALKPLDIEGGVELGIPCPLQSKVPVMAPPLLSDGAQVGVDGKHPPLSAAGVTERGNKTGEEQSSLLRTCSGVQ